MNVEPAVVATELCKDYGGVRAVDRLSLTIEAGEVFALLGPNGAGKTTTVEMLEGHRRPTSGSARVLGYDPRTGGREYRERIGPCSRTPGWTRTSPSASWSRSTPACIPGRATSTR